MATSVLRRLANLAPGGFRRSVAGAFLDVKTLPLRLRDPSRRGEPLHMLHNVGGGDYREVGEHTLRILRDHADLTAQDQVLDIGCGTGRAAGPLAHFLGPGGGRYLGFDVSRVGVAMCQRHFRREACVAFVHLDVWNGDYNPTGRVAEADVRFPADDASIDVAFAMSVFTHMRLAGVRSYLAEAGRVLRPGGRLAFTAFTLNDGRSSPGLFDFTPFETDSGVFDPQAPERSIGHGKAALSVAIEAAGLRVRRVYQGRWRAPSDYDGTQDLWVAEKV
ncbi:class I SAM-dependent methyltransferase [Phenylobacterium sp.]|uniref:class I SAM-dependent methyltransferase n=1 Tax=Phenylobacterium sp. TaxID=1871053 RepID=UPI00286BC6AA|nr:class I SAM-dependent methyltransferase [Phenylobacterium sp.]